MPTPRFDLVLITVPSGVISTNRLGEQPFLIRQGDQFYLYGQDAHRQWDVTLLNSAIVRDLDLPFPRLGKEKILPYAKKNKGLFKHIADKQAHCLNPIDAVQHEEKTYVFA